MTTTATTQDAADLDNSDLLNLVGLFSETEIELRDKVRGFVDARIRPNIADWYRKRGLPPRDRGRDGRPRATGHAPARLRLPGTLRGRIRPRRTGTRSWRLGTTDLRLRAGVAGDVRDPQIRLRSAEEPVPALGMAKGEIIGCFGLTEPTAGSDRNRWRPRQHAMTTVRGPSMEPSRWIGFASSPISPSSGPRPTKASAGSSSPPTPWDFTATPIEQKLSMRASIQCDIDIVDVQSARRGGPARCAWTQGAVLLPSTRHATESCGARWAPPETPTRWLLEVCAGEDAVRQTALRLSRSPSRSW